MCILICSFKVITQFLKYDYRFIVFAIINLKNQFMIFQDHFIELYINLFTN